MNTSPSKDLSGTIGWTARSTSSFTHGENNMTKFKTLGALCLMAALAAASPALARDGRGGGGPRGNGGFHASGAQFAGSGVRGGGYGGGYRSGGFRGGGVGPGIAAGLVAGAVLGGAYYGAPGYYGNSYAYDNGYDGGYDNGYAVSSGYDCQPGTWFRDEYGRRHLCQ
jgi:hypothetical protein